ncbi:MAG TPA: class I SAM-dependent methyltransferase [Candidatus Woesebacteria bacterium]|nr:class I SAM-dependent methyltransferase [Candidatus Woesebacteria bacterium]HNS94431.1 class I SAM-dependent methyltransferase [Candidatus Woesebacteria bacterium]
MAEQLFLLRIVFLLVELILLVGIVWYCVYVTALLVSRYMEVPFVPTDSDAVQAVFDYLRPQKGKRFLEIGFGDGRVICYAVKKYGLLGHGVDTNPVFVHVARMRAWLMGIAHKISFERKDARQASFKQADIIFIFMLPALLHDVQIQHGLQKQAKRGTYVVSHWYPITYFAKQEVFRFSGKDHETYVYKI